MSGGDKDLSEEEFTKRAIKQLRKPPQKGIHSVYSGFNDAFRKYFDKDPSEEVDRLAHEGKIAKRDTEGGVKLYLVEEAPEKADADKAVDKIVNTGGPESPKEKDFSGEAPPTVVDEKGMHETTEYALVASEDRFWLRNFREDGKRIAVKSVYTSKEDLKSMDRDITEWRWDGDEKVWAVNSDSIEYIIDHFLSNGYKIALSPEISEYAIEKLGYSVDWIDREEAHSTEKAEQEHDLGQEIEEGPKKEEISDKTAETGSEESPESQRASYEANSENEGEARENIQVDDIVEHNSGKRGKVEEVNNGVLIVRTGPGEKEEWAENACKFLREGS